jgi:hypothetical protein|eukprot:524579-Prymnesium_polylepis.1
MESKTKEVADGPVLERVGSSDVNLDSLAKREPLPDFVSDVIESCLSDPPSTLSSRRLEAHEACQLGVLVDFAGLGVPDVNVLVIRSSRPANRTVMG